MAQNSDKDKARWEQMQENFDLLFSRVNDIGASQQQLRAQVDLTNQSVDRYYQEQQLIRKQVQATGQAVAKFTLSQFDDDAKSFVSQSSALSHHQEEEEFDNGLFADKHQHNAHGKRHHHDHHHTALPRHSLPKLYFPKFDGSHPKIWIDKCLDYFHIYAIPEILWVQTATMHFEGNAAKWLQAQKKKHRLGTWKSFCAAVDQKFGADDYRSALTELLALRQTKSVEEYTTAFEALQFEICMHNTGYDDLFFVSKYIGGLKDEIRATVESQVPPTVDRAAVIAKIQQRLPDRAKLKQAKQPMFTQPAGGMSKSEPKPGFPPSSLWRERQLRDYRKANGLCFHCGDKFDPTHPDVCPKRSTFRLSAAPGAGLLKLHKGDITVWSVDGAADAIVNAANERMLGGGGVDGAIHQAAGPQLVQACRQVPEVKPGVRCPTGEARITPAFELPVSRVIHTVGPIYDMDKHPEVSLKKAYENSLKLAKENGIQYIAFPAISCGVFRYPPKEASKIAVSTAQQFSEDIKEVHFVLFSDDLYNIWRETAQEKLSQFEK